MSHEEIAQARKLEEIFLPSAAKLREEKRKSDNPGSEFSLDNVWRFAHYTSAESALKIIKSKHLWMRNTTCMIDYREVEHGHGLLVKYFDTPGKRDSFFLACDAVADGVAHRAMKAFDESWDRIRVNTFIACASEHDESEDNNGRLSMWRMSGTHPRVALVFNIPTATQASSALGVEFSPVLYLNETAVNDSFDRVIKNIAAEQAFLSTIPDGLFEGMVFQAFLNGVSCVKHDGFKEEREWRVIRNTAISSEPSLLEKDVACIDGVPQPILKIPLDENVSDKLAGLDLPKILSRVIIGPTQFGRVVYDAFIQALDSMGVADPAAKVVVSNLPIRD